MLEATVVSVPRGIQDRIDYAGMSCCIEPGERILMRYDVVFSYINQPDRDTPIYKNVLLHEGEEYWKVDIQKIFGIIRGDHIEMINGYVLCDGTEEDRTTNSTIVIPEHYRTIQRKDRMTIRSIGAPLYDRTTLAVAEGDTVLTQAGVAQRYEIDDRPFYIIKQSHILARG